MSRQDQPFFALGDLLRKLRTSLEKTQEDVSAAIEIEIEHLKSLEQGSNRPSEEVLLMLIQHFNASDEHAERLWQLAGYAGEPDMDEFLSNGSEEENATHAEHDLPPGLAQLPNVISMGISVSDPRIVYTDLAKVEINDFGVVMNFHQLGGAPDAKPLAVAKVGMSRAHAEKVISLLQNTLKQYDKQRESASTKGKTYAQPKAIDEKSSSQKSQKKNQ